MAEPAFSRVLFVIPPSGLYRRDDRCQSRVEDQSVRIVLPPVDLALLGALARRAGAEARICDYSVTGGGWPDLERDLAEFGPDLVVFSVTTATLEADLEVARLAREACPGVFVVARGDFFATQGEEALEACPELGLAMHGEVEENFEALVREGAPECLDGVIRRDGASGGVVRNAGRPLVGDLDALPLPARDLLDNARYLSPETGRPLTVVKASRGCFARCIFCPAAGRKLRVRSVDSVVAELRQSVEEFGIRDFLFDGDTFTARKGWLIELCARIEAEGLRIRWGCNSRVDTMDDERARALKRAGCVLVAFGVESGDDAMLEKMRKGTRVAQAEAAVAACKRAGLGTHAFYVIGLPWETRETLARTIGLMRRLDTDLFDINIATPLPGTPLYEMVREEGLLGRAEGDGPGSYASASVRSRALTAEELTRWRRRALLGLYARPRYVARLLWQAMRRGHLRHYLAAAMGRLKGLLSG